MLRKLFCIHLLQIVICSQCVGQAEDFIYCLGGGDSLRVSLDSEIWNSDTLKKTYFEDYSNQYFEVWTINDTMYSVFNNNLYFLGTDNALIGDTWTPLRYNFMSFIDSSEYCPNLMSLNVSGISQVVIGTNTHNIIELMDNDISGVTYQFVSGVGGTEGGILYNLRQQDPCDIIFDFYEPQFESYCDSNGNCYANSFVCLDLSTNSPEINSLKWSLIDKKLEFSDNEQLGLTLFNVRGEFLQSGDENFLSMENLSGGIYIISITRKNKIDHLKLYYDEN